MTDRPASSHRFLATLAVPIFLVAATLVPRAAHAVVNLVWSCTSATVGSSVDSCAGTWSWQVGASGLLVASAVTYGGYSTGTWRLWQNIPSNEYVFICSTDLAVGAPEGCPSPGVYTHEWYVLKSTLQSDTQAPTTPSGVSATAASSTQINVTWTASTDNVGVTGYLVERCQGASCSNFSQVGTPSASPFNNTGLTASTTYRYRVRATDAVTNLSSYSSIVSATTSAADTTPPSTPGGLTATPASNTQINLSWTASTDNVAVTGYLVERCQGASCSNFSQIATPAGTSHNDTGLSASTTYRYRVGARDAVPNYSSYSSIVSATTQAAGDTTPPSTPSGLSVTPQLGGKNSLTWNASTDNVAVTGYRVERCAGVSCSNFAEIATPATTAFLDEGLVATTHYRYRVRARDAVPNYSGYSTVSGATPADCD